MKTSCLYFLVFSSKNLVSSTKFCLLRPSFACLSDKGERKDDNTSESTRNQKGGLGVSKERESTPIEKGTRVEATMSIYRSKKV